VAQKQRKPQPAASTNLKPFYWLLGLIALVGAGWLAVTTMKTTQAAQEPIQLPPEALNNSSELVKQAKGIKLGPDNAPVRLFVFSDYQCPACRQFTTAVEPSLRTEFINSGKVQLIYYDYPLTSIHKWAFLAARAGRCAEDQNKFWEYHDHVLGKQNDWAFSQSAPLDKLRDYAREVQLDQKAFNECLGGDKHADLVTANLALGNQLRVRGTPALFMNGQLLDREWQDYGLLKQRLESVLAPAATSTSAQ
jgi:protein-disulfide isomerase